MSMEKELKRVRDKEGSKAPATTEEADEQDAREKREKKESDSGAQVGTRFSAAEIHENIRKAADEEMRRPAGELVWSALSSGLLVGFTFLAVGWLQLYFPGDRRHIAAFLGYPLGFVLIASTHETLAQIVLIWLTTGPIGAFGFKHSIAGAVEAFYLASAGGVSWGTALWQFELPALIGNILGGVVLVALVNHGQAATSNS